MANMCAKIKRDAKNKYRRMMTTDAIIYSNDVIRVVQATPYVPGAALEEGEWFSIQDASTQQYSIDLMTRDYTTLDFDNLTRNEFENIDYIFVEIDNLFCFQNISKAKLVSKKSVLCLGDNFTYQDDRKEIVINNYPDAIYDKDTDVLYFKRLESITGIFKGIDLLFREATEEETAQFLASDFIQLKDGYDTSNVKTANRKRIALAQRTLANLDDESKNNIFAYIGEYCPDLRVTETSFEIGTEDELKMLLYGIEQRFYTTIVGNEQRIANSVIPFNR